ncbi:hypothetical protein HN499_01965 [archaeon]|jgi:hypothetical protein|nr:hypothetical protein [archaeon]
MMDEQRYINWIKDKNAWISPPGCLEGIMSVPSGEDKALSVGLVMEHRFAFYFWALFASKRKSVEPKPILISLDSHDDVGTEGEVYGLRDDLNQLNLKNRLELGLFSWLRLRQLNDGQILPTLYLNFFSDVFILRNAKQLDNCNSNHKDREGNPHKIRQFCEVEELLNEIPENCPIYLDIDLDFFTTIESNWGRKREEQLKSETEIRSFLSLKGQFMKPIIDRLVGLTIALEPEYCGGLFNSLRVLEILNEEFFNSTLLCFESVWNK